MVSIAMLNNQKVYIYRNNYGFHMEISREDSHATVVASCPVAKVCCYYQGSNTKIPSPVLGTVHNK